MKVVQKRMIAAGCIGVLVIGGAVVVSRHSTYDQKKNMHTDYTSVGTH